MYEFQRVRLAPPRVVFYATKDTSILLVRCYEVRDQIENRILLTVLNGKAHLPFHMLMNAYMKNVFFQTYFFRVINLPLKNGKFERYVDAMGPLSGYLICGRFRSCWRQSF